MACVGLSRVCLPTMDQEGTLQNDMRIKVPLGEMKSNKKKKGQMMHEIVSNFCAVVNSHGGRMTLNLESGAVTISRKDVRDLIKTIEQQLSNLLGDYTSRDIIHLVSEELDEIVYDVDDVSCLCTLHLNIYFPTDTQVVMQRPNTPITDIKEILWGRRIVNLDDLVNSDDYHKDFVKDKPIYDNLKFESKTVQFKYLKDEESIRVSLGDRMTNKANKFANYVSAFANHQGGHIYYGVEDEHGIVKGEMVNNKDKIREKVSKAMNEIIWPVDDTATSVGSKVTKGKHWDIFFEPVKDEEGDLVSSTFVIVIYVAYCRGGVFATEPESYYIKDNKTARMTFQEWKKRIDQDSLPITIQRTKFSSTTKEARYYGIMEKIMDLRNRGTGNSLKQYIEYVNRQYRDTSVELATLSQEATCAFRVGDFNEAEKLIKRYDDLNEKSKENILISESMGLYIKSANQRAQENFQKSYEFAADGLQKAEGVSPGLIQAWFCTHLGLVSNILANKETDINARYVMVTKAKSCFKRALDYSQRIPAFLRAVMDLQQKVYIHLSQAYLGCSLKGSMIPCRDVSEDEVKCAENCLEMVKHYETEEFSLSPLRKIQYLLATSGLYLRQWQLRNSKDQHDFTGLIESWNLSKKALKIATNNEFNEMIQYCKNQSACIAKQFK